MILPYFFHKVLNKIRWSLSPKYKKSYSQNAEDIIISRIFKNLKKKNVFYLDIGTNHPIIYNNTYSLYKNGSKGICIEPNIELGKLIKRIRPRDEVYTYGISDKIDILKYYSYKNSEYNTFSAEEVASNSKQGFVVKEITDIPIKTIDIILEGLDKIPDLISIDIEGYDERVIRSFNFNRWKPIVWCVETVYRDGFKYKKNQPLIDYMKDNGYVVYGDTFLNTIFVDKDSFSIIEKV